MHFWQYLNNVGLGDSLIERGGERGEELFRIERGYLPPGGN